jgi:hypothetical protein
MQNLKKWIVTASAVLIAVSAGFSLSANAFLGIAAGLLILVVIPLILIVQLKKPFWGLMTLVIMAVAFPVEFRGFAGVMMSSSFPLTALVCAIWLLGIMIIDRGALFDSARVVYAALTFSGVTLIAFGVGQYPWFRIEAAPLPAQVAQLGLFLLSVCLFLVVGHQLKHPAQLKWLTWMFLAAGTITCVMQAVTQLNFVAKWTTRPGSVGSLFWTWFVALSFSQALLNRSLSLRARAFLFGVTALSLYHGIFQIRSWASGWLPPLVALSVIFLITLPRLSVGSALLAIPVGLFLARQFSDFLMHDEEYSVMTRGAAMQVMWQLIERSPLLGLGPANYYYYTQNFPILGWYVSFISHNNYLDLLAQTGLIGLLAFAWFAFEICWLTLRLYARLPEGFAKAYAIGACGGLAGSLASGMLGDWFIPFYYNAGILGFRSSLLFWVFAGGILALKRMTSSYAEIGASTHRLRGLAHAGVISS